jgi:hypothetical protein
MNRRTLIKVFVFTTALLCIAGCLADLALLWVFGSLIPGYDQWTSTISSLGVSGSPVSGAVTIWSVILGMVYILFGLGFLEAYREKGKEAGKAAVFLMVYGFGEGIASGVFKPDHVHGIMTWSALVHNLLGGAGVVSLLLLPFALMRIFPRSQAGRFHTLSAWVVSLGFLSILLFSFRVVCFDTTFLNTYKGLWQRAFLVDYYVYFIVIALMMMKRAGRMFKAAN